VTIARTNEQRCDQSDDLVAHQNDEIGARAEIADAPECGCEIRWVVHGFVPTPGVTFEPPRGKDLSAKNLASGGMSVSLLVSRNDLMDPVVSRSVLSPTRAGVALLPDDGDEVRLWILRIFDGHPSDPATKHPHEYYREVHPPLTAEACVVEAEQALRSFYGLAGWVKDGDPLPGYARSWSRRAH
jgi:hypothetical protein